MRKLLVIPLVAAVATAAVFITGGNATPDPQTCVGYPEPRIQLESQSWWSPQPGPADHPGTGQQGHVHVGMCFPLYQHISGDTLHLDVTVKLHNMPALPSKLRVVFYGDVVQWKGPLVPPCASADCEHVYSLDVPLSDLTFSGWRLVAPFLNVTNSNGDIQRQWPHWFVYIDNGQSAPPPGTVGTDLEDVGGDTWYSDVVGGTTGKYANAVMERASVPWDEETGELTPLSGTWTPTVRFEAQTNFAYIDPALHATPPSHGTVVYEATTTNTGYHTQQLEIDTTQLADGPHRLLIGTGNVGTNGTHTGVLVVPFVVDNSGCT